MTALPGPAQRQSCVPGGPGCRAGDRVALEHTGDPWTRLRPGDEGTVSGHDPRAGQIRVSWDDGSTLAMIPASGDRIHLI